MDRLTLCGFSCPRISSKVQKYWLLALVFILAFFSTAEYLRFGGATVGIDGYYYVLQLDSFQKTGAFYFQTRTPFVLYLLAGLNWVIQDTNIAIRTGALLLHVLLSLTTFGITFLCSRKISLGLFSIILLNISGLHSFLIVEFVNYLGGVAFITSGFFFLLLAWTKRSLIWATSSLLFLSIAAGAHRSSIPIIFTILASLGIFLLLDSKCILRKRIATLLLTFAFITPAVVSVTLQLLLPIGLLTELSIVPSIPSIRASRPEIAILLMTVIFVGFSFWRRKLETLSPIQRRVVGCVLIWSLLFLLNPFINSEQGFLSIGGRLRTLAYLPVAIVIPLIFPILKEFPQSVRLIYVASISTMMIWSAFFMPPPLGMSVGFLKDRRALYESLKAVDLSIEKDSVVVAPHGDQFLFTYLTGISSQQRYPRNKTDSIYWLLNDINNVVKQDPSLTSYSIPSSTLVLVQDNSHFHSSLNDKHFLIPLIASNRHLGRFVKEQELLPSNNNR